MKPCAERSKADGFPGGPARFGPFGGGDEHTRRTGIAIASDIRVETIGGDLESNRDSIDQVLIGLVHQKRTDVGSFATMLTQKFTDRARDLARGLQNYRAAIHFEGPIEGQAKIFGKGAIRVKGAAEDASLAFRRTDEASAGAIAEQNRDAALHGLAENDAGHFLGADDKDFAQAIAKTRGEGHGKQGSGASERNVNRWGATETEPMRDGDGRAGELTFRTAAGNQDHAEGGSRKFGFVETGLRGSQGEIGDGLIIGGEAALVDAAHVLDPLGVTTDVSADLRVGDDPFREVGSEFTKEGHEGYFPWSSK